MQINVSSFIGGDVLIMFFIDYLAAGWTIWSAVCVCVCVCVSEEQLSNEMFCDVDIWLDGSPWSNLYVKVVG